MSPASKPVIERDVYVAFRKKRLVIEGRYLFMRIEDVVNAELQLGSFGKIPDGICVHD